MSSYVFKPPPSPNHLVYACLFVSVPKNIHKHISTGLHTHTFTAFCALPVARDTHLGTCSHSHGPHIKPYVSMHQHRFLLKFHINAHMYLYDLFCCVHMRYYFSQCYDQMSDEKQFKGVTAREAHSITSAKAWQ